ncbi:MAG: aspartate kinase, partial [Pseudomonadales bacterium]|nr:aspartate kinase [Pseudomonadales bacterium]
MSLFVQKFGGTSVASIERIEHVARRVIRAKNEGHDVVVVVSAMGKETDRLVELAEEVDYQGLDARREMDVLLSTGEQVTISLLSMMLMKHGFKSESVLGRQANILTDKEHTRARILDIDASFLKNRLSDGVIPVVAGFQGTDDSGNITTLGRGGSDTTAVALAAVLAADECQIYTDVEGVFTTDPRVVEGARCLDEITFEEMLELASLG